MKKTLPTLSTLATLMFTYSAQAQISPTNPRLPNTNGYPVAPVLQAEPQATVPNLSDYAGTYLCLTNYYNVSGVSPLEYVLLNNGTISVTPKYQAKYPYIRVSGTFQRDGTLIITNNQTDGDIFTSRGIINRRLQKISGTFTSTSAGTGNFVCNKL